MKEFFVYMLRCRDGTFYTGIINDYEGRVRQHQEGVDSGCYTYKRRPVKLVYVASFREVMDAIAWEKQLKGWSRKKKIALINQDQKMLEIFSKRKSVQEKILKENKSVSS